MRPQQGFGLLDQVVDIQMLGDLCGDPVAEPGASCRVAL